MRTESGETLGVLVIDVTLQAMSETLTRLPIAERGFAFIVDERGLLVAASHGPVNSPSGSRMSPAESTDPAARGMATLPYMSDAAATTTPIHRFHIQGQPARATVRALSPYPGIHWRVIVGAPESAFLADAQALQRRQVVLAVVAAMGSVMLALVLGRQVTRPLLRLRDHVRRVGRGDLAARLELHATRELRELSQELNRMSDGLMERIELERSLELAMEVQQSLLPSDVPRVRGFDLAARCRYCDVTGGDYYDFIETGAAATIDGERSVVVAIGDALGHGISSALLMATARAALRAGAHQRDPVPSLGDMLTRVNGVLSHGARNGRFMTMLLMRVDLGAGAIRWARAGHEPFVLYHAITDTFAKPTGGGIPLGIESDFVYEEHYQEGLEPGTLLVAATDGLFEAQNVKGEMFGRERVRGVIRGVSDHIANAQAVVEALDAALTAFLAGASVKDDVTFVVIRVRPSDQNELTRPR